MSKDRLDSLDARYECLLVILCKCVDDMSLDGRYYYMLRHSYMYIFMCVCVCVYVYVYIIFIMHIILFYRFPFQLSIITFEKCKMLIECHS